MKLSVTVMKETRDSYTGKRGAVETLNLTCRENDPATLMQLVDYQLQEGERSMFGKMAGKSVTIEVTEIPQIFAGRPRLRGRIVETAK